MTSLLTNTNTILAQVGPRAELKKLGQNHWLVGWLGWLRNFWREKFVVQKSGRGPSEKSWDKIIGWLVGCVGWLKMAGKILQPTQPTNQPMISSQLFQLSPRAEVPTINEL